MFELRNTVVQAAVVAGRRLRMVVVMSESSTAQPSLGHSAVGVVEPVILLGGNGSMLDMGAEAGGFVVVGTVVGAVLAQVECCRTVGAAWATESVKVKYCRTAGAAFLRRLPCSRGHGGHTVDRS